MQTGEAQATLPVSVCMLYVDEYGSVWIGRVLLMRRVFSQVKHAFRQVGDYIERGVDLRVVLDECGASRCRHL